MDVLVCNKILIVNGSICNEQIHKLVVNCISLLNKSIVEREQYGINAYVYFQNHFERNIVYDKLEEYLK